MTARSTFLTRGVAWVPIIAQVAFPAMAAAPSLENREYADHERWLANTASSLAPAIQEGALSDYARAKLQAVPQELTNQAMRDTLSTVFPESQLRGGISLEDGTRYRSAELDLLIPLQHNTSSLLFGQFGLRDHDDSSFNGRTFISTGLGYRYQSGEWLTGVNAFLDADIRHHHLRASLGLEAGRESLSLASNYYFPLTGWKSSDALTLHDERPARGFDLRAKGSLPRLPWLTAELSYEQFFGEKVDILGNNTLAHNPSAVGGSLVWRPVPLIELRGGYRDAGNGGAQTEGGLQLNYTFGTPLSEQLDPAKVLPVSANINRAAFVDRNYNMVMEYREQASRIRISAPPVVGTAGRIVNLGATVNSRYPITGVEWVGDVELLSGLQTPTAANSVLILPQLPLNSPEQKEFSLYLRVTDSRGTTVTSERIPVTVHSDASSYRSHVNVINPDTVLQDGQFILSTPLTPMSPSVVIEWHYVRERSEKEWLSLKPETVSYKSGDPAISVRSLGGEERDGQWVERVKLTRLEGLTLSRSDLTLEINAAGKDGRDAVTASVIVAQKDFSISQVERLLIDYTPGTVALNGSAIAPVVGSVLRARPVCKDDKTCQTDFVYQWEFSVDGSKWVSVKDATDISWQLPATYAGESLQNKFIRVRVMAEKDT